MSKMERSEIRRQADNFEVFRSLKIKRTRQETWKTLKNFAEGVGIGWMIRKFL